MELVYLWVEDYQCLKDVEFNFGGEHIFHYDKDKNELTSKENPQYIEGFFNVDPNSNTKISNVTGIVGKNGAGKSTALDAILRLYALGSEKYIGKNKVLVFSLEYEGKIKIFAINSTNNRRVDITEICRENEGVEKKWNECESFNVYVPIIEQKGMFLKSFIYLNNIFEHNREIIGSISNISSFFLFTESKNRYIDYISKDILNQLHLLQLPTEYKYPFHIPEELFVYYSLSLDDLFNYGEKTNNDSGLLKLSEFHERVSADSIYKNEEDIFKYRMYIHLIKQYYYMPYHAESPVDQGVEIPDICSRINSINIGKMTLSDIVVNIEKILGKQIGQFYIH